VWAIHLGLLLVFWNEPTLMTIDNKLGNFYGLKNYWESKANRRWAWVQIEFNLWDGLIEELELVCKEIYGDKKWNITNYHSNVFYAMKSETSKINAKR
jgi:hypothetical protein